MLYILLRIFRMANKKSIVFLQLNLFLLVFCLENEKKEFL